MRVALFVYGRFSTGPLQGTEECKKGETFPQSGRKRIVTKGRRPSTEDAATRLSEQQKYEKSHAIPAGFLPVPESKISWHSPGSDDRTVPGKAPLPPALPRIK